MKKYPVESHPAALTTSTFYGMSIPEASPFFDDTCSSFLSSLLSETTNTISKRHSMSFGGPANLDTISFLTQPVLIIPQPSNIKEEKPSEEEKERPQKRTGRPSKKKE